MLRAPQAPAGGHPHTDPANLCPDEPASPGRAVTPRPTATRRWQDLPLGTHHLPQKALRNQQCCFQPTHVQEQGRLWCLSQSLPVQLLSPLPSKHIMVSGGVFPTCSKKPKLGWLCCFPLPFSRVSSMGRIKEVVQTENAACWKFCCVAKDRQTQDTPALSPGQQYKGWSHQLSSLIITYLKRSISHQYFHNYSNTWDFAKICKFPRFKKRSLNMDRFLYLLIVFLWRGNKASLEHTFRKKNGLFKIISKYVNKYCTYLNIWECDRWTEHASLSVKYLHHICMKRFPSTPGIYDRNCSTGPEYRNV